MGPAPSRLRRAAPLPASALLAALLAASCAGLQGRTAGETAAGDPDGEAADYVVTIHGAVVLPFKPVERTPWDGSAAAPLPEAEGFLAVLAQQIQDGAGAMVRAAAVVARWAQQGIEAPDCYPVVLLDGKAFGGEELEDQDDFLPAWELKVPIRGTARDSRVLAIRVRDADLSDDDNVGSWETTVGDLLSRTGVREITFVDRDGRTEAGGIVALRISVERP